jgi:2-polyprenyl-6-methoxyphenol hydroxylase-like FAD-dependent oxidoreductase
VTVLVLGTGPAGLVLGCLLQAAARLRSLSSSRAYQDYFAENYVGI